MGELSDLAEGVRLWAREIILVLFLAGALEMLLPETEVKRFARVAVGFFVVLAVGRPLLSALGGGLIFDPGLAGLGSWELGAAPAGVLRSGGAGSDAVERGKEIWQASRDRALAAARAGLEAQVAALAKREEAVAEAEAEVDLDSDPSSPSYGVLRSVRLRVRLGRGRADFTVGAPGAVSPVVVEVRPVVVGPQGPYADGVDARPGPESGAAGSGGPLAVDTGGAEEAGQERAAVALAKCLRNELVLLLGVPADGITVEVWP